MTDENVQKVINIVTHLIKNTKYACPCRDVVSAYIPRDARGTMVETLNTCTCCDRHQAMRPSQFDLFIDHRLSTQDKDQEHSCPCKCRMFSRSICMTYDDQDDPYDDQYDQGSCTGTDTQLIVWVAKAIWGGPD
jgi:hypothetical protein